MGKRFRLMYKFWLDVNKPDEFELAETIDELKQNHYFVRTIREGIQLIVSLHQRRTDVLLAMFPWVEQALQPKIQPVLVAGHDQLQDQLKRLEQLILETGARPAPKFTPSRSAGNEEMPDFEVVKSNVDATANFLSSLAALGQ
nr:hypothetical protein [Nitrosomonas nitrosa]